MNDGTKTDCAKSDGLSRTEDIVVAFEKLFQCARDLRKVSETISTEITGENAGEEVDPKTDKDPSCFLGFLETVQKSISAETILTYRNLDNLRTQTIIDRYTAPKKG